MTLLEEIQLWQVIENVFGILANMPYLFLLYTENTEIRETLSFQFQKELVNCLISYHGNYLNHGVLVLFVKH